MPQIRMYRVPWLNTSLRLSDFGTQTPGPHVILMPKDPDHLARMRQASGVAVCMGSGLRLPGETWFYHFCWLCKTWVASNFSELSSRTLRNAGFAADDRLHYEFLSLLAVELVSFSKAHGRQMETTFPIVLCC